MVAVSDFSGLVISACALANAAAIAPMVSLDRCIARLHGAQEIKTDRPRFGTLGADAMTAANDLAVRLLPTVPHTALYNLRPDYDFISGLGGRGS